MLSKTKKKDSKVYLKDKIKGKCRFCGLQKPEVSFKKAAHAVPEMFGNKNIFSSNECDGCNKVFGETIENQLGNWSKPYRSMGRIFAKDRIPSLKGCGWRVDHGDKFPIVQSLKDADVPFFIDEEKKTMTSTIVRDTYIPDMVFKAFLKIALNFLPEILLNDFRRSVDCVSSKDDGGFYSNFKFFQVFFPGLIYKDRVDVIMFVRKKCNSNEDLPCAFFILVVNNYLYQVPIFSDSYNVAGLSSFEEIKPFPFLMNSFKPLASSRSGVCEIKSSVMNFSSKEKIKGDVETINWVADGWRKVSKEEAEKYLSEIK